MKVKSLLILSLLPMMLLMGCDKYGFVPIVGTWRLMTYTSGVGSAVQVPATGNSYCLGFDGDGSFRGNGYINTFWGEFTLDGDKIKMVINDMTQVNADPVYMQEEQKFINALKNVTSYDVTGGNLIMYYGDNKMTFNRESVIIPTN